MRSHWWCHNDVNTIFSATENNFGFFGHLASGDLKFFESFYQNKKALLIGIQKIKSELKNLYFFSCYDYSAAGFF